MKYDFVSERTGPETAIHTPQDVLPLLERFGTKRQEHFLVLSLKSNHAVQRLSIISIGIANRTLVHPREVFLPAIKNSAVAVILCHNHPSGDCSPSRDDMEVTKRLCQAGDILGIQVIDHLIFSTKGKYVSMVELGQMPSSSSHYSR